MTSANSATSLSAAMNLTVSRHPDSSSPHLQARQQFLERADPLQRRSAATQFKNFQIRQSAQFPKTCVRDFRPVEAKKRQILQPPNLLYSFVTDKRPPKT